MTKMLFAFIPSVDKLLGHTEIQGLTTLYGRDLVKDTLRMRPERIILGEARGSEMVDILVGMNTGHDGVMFTVHANDVRDTFERIETMVLMGQQLPLLSVRRQIVNALDLIVHLVRDRDRRVVSGIGEVRRLEMEQPVIETIFEYDSSSGCAAYADFRELLENEEDLDAVKVMTLAVSLGGVETLIQHPSSMTHAAMKRDDRIAALESQLTELVATSETMRYSLEQAEARQRGGAGDLVAGAGTAANPRAACGTGRADRGVLACSPV